LAGWTCHERSLQQSAMLPYTGQRGHAWLTVLRLSDKPGVQRVHREREERAKINN